MRKTCDTKNFETTRALDRGSRGREAQEGPGNASYKDSPLQDSISNPSEQALRYRRGNCCRA
eukprot:3056879-Pyramimonas_sp.AAC.1